MQHTSATLDQVLKMYLDSRDVSPLTLKSYRSYVLAYMYWLHRNSIHFFNSSVKNLVDYKNWLLSEKRETTSRVYLTALKGFFAWGQETGNFDNLARNIKIPKAYKGGLKRPLSIDQAKMLLSSIQVKKIIGIRDYAILNLLLKNGLRLIELSRLNYSDLFIENNNIFIRIQSKGKYNKTDIVRLQPFVYSAIERYLITRKELTSTDPLFCSQSRQNPGERLKPQYLSLLVRKYLDEIGLTSDRNYTAHSLRHTTASLLKQSGVPLDQISRKMRHSNLDTTRIYTKFIEDAETYEDHAGNILEQILN